jgi:hypothetical protein
VQLARLVCVPQHTMPILLPTVRDATIGTFTTRRRRDSSNARRMSPASKLPQTCGRQCSTSELCSNAKPRPLCMCKHIDSHTRHFLLSFFGHLIGSRNLLHVSSLSLVRNSEVDFVVGYVQDSIFLILVSRGGSEPKRSPFLDIAP